MTIFSNSFVTFFLFLAVVQKSLPYPPYSFFSPFLFHCISSGRISKIASFSVLDSLSPQSNSSLSDFPLYSKLEFVSFVLSFQD